MTRDHDPGLAAIARRYPRWEVWKGLSGLFYARLLGTSDQPVRGEDTQDLSDQITRAMRLGGDEPPS